MDIIFGREFVIVSLVVEIFLLVLLVLGVGFFLESFLEISVLLSEFLGNNLGLCFSVKMFLVSCSG